MDNQLNDTPNYQESIPQAHFIVKLFVLLYVLAYITIVFVLLIDGWVHGYAITMKLLFLTPEASLPPTFISAIHTILGSLLGCGVLAIVSFHKYVAYQKGFESPHVWGYFCGPWLAATLGLIIFALLQSGLLIFSGNLSGNEQPETANLGYLAIGFLAGFGWYRVTKIIERLVTRVFILAPSKTDDDPLISENTGKNDAD